MKINKRNKNGKVRAGEGKQSATVKAAFPKRTKSIFDENELNVPSGG